MVDNIIMDPGAAGDTVAADDIGGVKFQRIKLVEGADGVNDGDISSANPLPVELTDADGTAAANLVTLAGAVAGTEMQVDVLTVPAPLSTTGGGTEAAALRVTLANDSTGLVSVDDGGGALTVDNGGTFAVQSTLQANSGVDIGDVDVTSVVPGTGATNAGKAIDSAVGATDTGVAMLAQHDSDVAHLTTAEGDYDVLRLSDFGALQTAPEQHHILDALNATTGWAVLGNDAANLATTKKHVVGTDALTFDKVDGAANTVIAGIAKTISSIDLGSLSLHDIIQTSCYVPNIDDVAYVFIRVGTDATNYNEWRIPGVDLTADEFLTLAFNVGDADHGGITGNGWNPAAITYIAVGVAFSTETDTLAGIIFDALSLHTNIHTSAELNAEVSSSVSTANINMQKVGGSVTDKGAGNVSNGSQRVVLATDDVNAAAIKTAIEILDNIVSGSEAQCDILTVPAPLSTTGGGTEAAALRVTLANDSTGVLSVDDNGGALTVDNGGTFAVQVDDVGSVVDANNSTTTPLAGAAAFTGTGTDLLGYSTVCVTLASDVDSAVDGMTFQFSTDDTNWDDVNSFTFDFSASPTRRFEFPVTARYFRIVYTNGAGAQSFFRVQTILHTANQLTSVHRLQDDLNPDRSVQVVKSVLFAQAAGTGNFTAIDATAAGNLMVSLQEISNGMDIGAGNAGTETLRVSVSTDDVNLSAIKTAVEGTLTTTPAVVGGGTEAAAQRVTIANDSTGLVSVDDGGGALTVDNGGTFATQATLQAGTALIGSVSAAPNVSTAYDGVTALTPKFAKLSTASTGNQALIAAVAAKTIRILSIQIIATASTNAIYINDGVADLYGDATRKIPLDVTGAAGLGGITLQMNQLGHFETAAVNRPININLGSTNGVIAIATYVEV